MPLLRPRIVLGLILGVVLVVSAGIVLRQSRQLSECRRQQAENLASLRRLQEELRRQNLPAAPAASEELMPAAESGGGLARRDAAISKLNGELSAARAAMAQLQAELSQANDERDKTVADADARRQKEQADWQSRVDTLQQQLDSAQAELEASRRRTAEMEAANDKLRNETSEGSKRGAEFEHTVASLQDLNRRRDAYLTSIIRRYRDLTTEFRGMSGMVDTSHDPNSSAFSGAALTRIQNTISLADDELHQLNELNDQARQLEKKLVKK